MPPQPPDNRGRPYRRMDRYQQGPIDREAQMMAKARLNRKLAERLATGKIGPRGRAILEYWRSVSDSEAALQDSDVPGFVTPTDRPHSGLPYSLASRSPGSGDLPGAITGNADADQILRDLGFPMQGIDMQMESGKPAGPRLRAAIVQSLSAAPADVKRRLPTDIALFAEDAVDRYIQDQAKIVMRAAVRESSVESSINNLRHIMFVLDREGLAGLERLKKNGTIKRRDSRFKGTNIDVRSLRRQLSDEISELQSDFGKLRFHRQQLRADLAKTGRISAGLEGYLGDIDRTNLSASTGRSGDLDLSPTRLERRWERLKKLQQKNFLYERELARKQSSAIRSSQINRVFRNTLGIDTALAGSGMYEGIPIQFDYVSGGDWTFDRLTQTYRYQGGRRTTAQRKRIIRTRKGPLGLPEGQILRPITSEYGPNRPVVVADAPTIAARLRPMNMMQESLMRGAFISRVQAGQAHTSTVLGPLLGRMRGPDYLDATDIRGLEELVAYDAGRDRVVSRIVSGVNNLLGGGGYGAESPKFALQEIPRPLVGLLGGADERFVMDTSDLVKFHAGLGGPNQTRARGRARARKRIMGLGGDKFLNLERSQFEAAVAQNNPRHPILKKLKSLGVSDSDLAGGWDAVIGRLKERAASEEMSRGIFKPLDEFYSTSEVPEGIRFLDKAKRVEGMAERAARELVLGLSYMGDKGSLAIDAKLAKAVTLDFDNMLKWIINNRTNNEFAKEVYAILTKAMPRTVSGGTLVGEMDVDIWKSTIARAVRREGLPGLSQGRSNYRALSRAVVVSGKSIQALEGAVRQQDWDVVDQQGIGPVGEIDYEDVETRADFQARMRQLVQRQRSHKIQYAKFKTRVTRLEKELRILHNGSLGRFRKQGARVWEVLPPEGFDTWDDVFARMETIREELVGATRSMERFDREVSKANAAIETAKRRMLAQLMGEKEGRALGSARLGDLRPKAVRRRLAQNGFSPAAANMIQDIVENISKFSADDYLIGDRESILMRMTKLAQTAGSTMSVNIPGAGPIRVSLLDLVPFADEGEELGLRYGMTVQVLGDEMTRQQAYEALEGVHEVQRSLDRVTNLYEAGRAQLDDVRALQERLADLQAKVKMMVSDPNFAARGALELSIEAAGDVDALAAKRDGQLSALAARLDRGEISEASYRKRYRKIVDDTDAKIRRLEGISIARIIPNSHRMDQVETLDHLRLRNAVWMDAARPTPVSEFDQMVDLLRSIDIYREEIAGAGDANERTAALRSRSLLMRSTDGVPLKYVGPGRTGVSFIPRIAGKGGKTALGVNMIEEVIKEVAARGLDFPKVAGLGLPGQSADVSVDFLRNLMDVFPEEGISMRSLSDDQKSIIRRIMAEDGEDAARVVVNNVMYGPLSFGAQVKLPDLDIAQDMATIFQNALTAKYLPDEQIMDLARQWNWEGDHPTDARSFLAARQLDFSTKKYYDTLATSINTYVSQLYRLSQTKGADGNPLIQGLTDAFESAIATTRDQYPADAVDGAAQSGERAAREASTAASTAGDVIREVAEEGQLGKFRELAGMKSWRYGAAAFGGLAVLGMVRSRRNKEQSFDEMRGPRYLAGGENYDSFQNPFPDVVDPAFRQVNWGMTYEIMARGQFDPYAMQNTLQNTLGDVQIDSTIYNVPARPGAGYDPELEY